MKPEKIFSDLLGLGENWRVMRIVHEAEQKLTIKVEETEKLWHNERCPKDGHTARFYDHAPKRQ